MTINKTISETQKIAEDKIITFPNGIPGFQDHTRFKLSMTEDKAGSTVYWLESLSDPATAFSLVDPVVFGLNYQLTLTDEETALLETENGEDLALLLMVSKKELTEGNSPESPVHANIKGPLVINTASRLGFQKLIKGSDLSISIHG